MKTPTLRGDRTHSHVSASVVQNLRYAASLACDRVVKWWYEQLLTAQWVQTEGTQQLASVDIWKRDRLLTGRLSPPELQHSGSCPLQLWCSLGSKDSLVCSERLSHTQWKLWSKLCFHSSTHWAHILTRSTRERCREHKHQTGEMNKCSDDDSDPVFICHLQEATVRPLWCQMVSVKK